MRWRISAWTHPEDPAGFKLREHSIPAIKFSSTDPVTPRGRCTITVPESYDWQNLIAVANPTDPADTSLIRLYREGQDNTTDPDTEYILERFKRRITDDNEAVVDLFGIAWKLAALNAAVLRWWDWETGATTTTFPDHVYGGENLLQNPDMELGTTTPEIYEIWHDATGGDLTLTVEGQTTAPAVLYNESAVGLNNKLELLSTVTDVLVDGQGTETEPWRIEFIVPQIVEPDMTANFAGLTGETESHLEKIQAGSDEIPVGWTRSQRADERAEEAFHGKYTIFRRSSGAEPSLNGDHSIVVAGTRFVGIQQIRSVTPGGIYQATGNVRSNTTGQEYRYVIRDLYEKFIAKVQVSPSADTWTEMTIPDIVIPADTTAIVVRAAIITPTPAGISYYDAFSFAEGLSESTLGVISNDIIGDADGTDHPAINVLPYVTIGAYDDSVDSAAVAWPRAERLTLRRGMHYGSHIYAGKFADLGYEYDLTPNGDTAQWDLELWDKANRGATLTGLAFVVGLGVSGGLIAGRIPKATRWLGEGAGGIITEQIDTAQEAATGIVERYFGDPDITEVTTLAAKAANFLDDDISNRLALNIELDDSAPVAYADFNVGDTAPFQAAGYMDTHDRRITEIGLAMTAAGDSMVWTQTITASKLLTGEQATREAVYDLLTEFKPFPERLPKALDAPFPSGGGIGLALIAASNAPEWMRRGARWVCDGINDLDVIKRALQEMIGTYGNVYLTPGTFNIDMTTYAGGAPGIVVPTTIGLIGAGQDATFIELVDADASAITAPLVEVNILSGIRDLSLEAYDGVTCLETSGSGATMTRLWIRALSGTDNSIGVHFNGGGGSPKWSVLEDSTIESITGAGTTNPGVLVTGNADWVHIRRNWISGGEDNIRLEDATSTIGHVWITDNEMISSGGHGINYDAAKGPYFGDIARNRIQDWGRNDGAVASAAIYLKGVSGVVVSDASTEIGYGMKIVDNAIEAGFGYGIELEDVTGATVSGNYIEDADGHGIYFSGDTDHSTITLNRIFYCGSAAADTWDAIHIATASDDNYVFGNTTRDSEAAVTDVRYALNVLGDNNLIGDNDFRFTGSAGTINDGGTGNQLTGNSNPAIADWTPTWTAVTTNPVLGDGILTGRSQQIGKWVTGTLRLVIGSTTTFGTGAWEFDLPVAASLAFDHVIGTVHIEDSGTGFHTAVAIWNDTDSLINIIDSGGAGKADVTTPITWANGDILTITFAYEVA